MNKRAFVSICIAIFVAMLGMGIISPLLTIYAQNMGASGIWLGIMYSGFSLSRALMQPVCGWLADKRGKKMLIVVGLSAYTLVSIAYSFATDMYQLTGVRLLHGLASALVIPVAQAYVGDLTPKGKEGTYMGLFSMSMQLGMAAGPIMGGSLFDIYSTMSSVFYTMAALAAMGLLCLVLFVPEVQPVHIRSSVKSAPMGVMLRDDKIKAIGLYLAARGILRQSISAFLPLFVVETFHSSLSEGATFASVYIFVEAISQLFIGPIADRFNRKTLMIIGGTITSVLAFFLARMGTPLALLLVLIPIGIMGTVGRIPALAYNVELGKKYGRMGSSMGVTNAAQDMGHFIGPLITGWAIDTYGVGSVFNVGAIAGLLILPMMTYWLFTKQREYNPGVATETVTVDPPK
jgi:MFS family permease